MRKLFAPLLWCFPHLYVAHPICVPGVERFSASQSRSHYYLCEEGANQPVLKECPDHHVYLMKLQRCVHMKERVPETILQKSLGQNVQLGSFYDARRGIYFPESSLWTRETLKNHLYKEDFATTKSSVEELRTMRERMDFFHFDANVKGFLFGGLVSVTASAGFTIETATLSEQLSIQLMFETTKQTKAIDKYVVLDYPDECDNPHYTHVVTEVTYGLAAYFNFLRTTESHENQWELEVDLKAAINLIPGLGIEADIGAELSEGQKTVLNRTELKMYGDFSPSDPSKPLPTNFTEAVHFYQQLPSMMGTEEEDWQDSTILDVRLTPIEDFCENTGNDYQPAGDIVIEKISEMMDQLEAIDTIARDLLSKEPSIRFNPVRENLNVFHSGVKSYQLEKKAGIKSILPEVLAGQLGEDDLLGLYNAYMSSPYETQISELFLRARKREVNAIEFLIIEFPQESNIGVVDYESANDVEYIFKRSQVIILDFHILSSKSLTQSYLDGNPVDESNLWYNDIQENAIIGSLLRNLSAFSLANVDMPDRGYLIKLSLLPEDEAEHFTMTALLNGEVISDQFVVPPNPAEVIPVPQDITHNSFKVVITKLNQFVTGATLTVTDLMMFEKPPIVRTWSFTPETEVGSDHLFHFDRLRPTHFYSVNIKYTTQVGSTPATLDSDVFSTLATSPPQNLVAKASSTEVNLNWKYPEVVADDLGFNREDFQYHVSLTGGPSTMTTSTSSLSLSLKDLQPGTKYQVDVTAFYPRDGLNGTGILPSAPASAVFYSSPLPPSNMEAVEVQEHSVKLKTTPPSQVGEGANIMYYIIEYTANGVIQQHVAETESFEVTNLARGTIYSFKVKVVTTDSESSFSDTSLDVTTLFIETEMEEAQEEVTDFLGDITNNIKALSSFCSYRASTNEDEVTVSFDSLTTSGNTLAGASMNIESGIFTAGATATYQVMASVKMVSGAGEHHRVWIRHNNQNVAESLIQSEFGNDNSGKWEDLASRTILLQLREGDTISLYHDVEGGKESLEDITFCVSLAKM